MIRTSLLTLFLVACGGPIGNLPVDTDDTADTSDSADTDDTGADVPNTTASIGLFQDCAEALASAIDLEPGTYSGTMDDWLPSLDGTCVAGSGAGPDKLFRIEVPPDHSLSVAYRSVGNDARLYFVENCNVSSNCLASVNAQGGNAYENLTWSNGTGLAKTVFVVLDSRDPVGTTWDLDVSLEVYVPPELLAVTNNCTGFDALDPIDESGTYEVSLDGFSSAWNASGSGCADGAYSAGTDGVASIWLDEGDTVTARWSHPFCDQVLYLKSTCGDLGTCVAGADDSYSGGAETLTYTNTTGQAGAFALVLDQYSTCGVTAGNPGTLTLTFASGSPVGGDTCADADALTPLGVGTHFVMLDEAGDDLDLGAGGCTGAATPGEDVFVPVTVPDGQELTARFTTAVGDAALYLLTDCDDADTCLEGSDGGSTEEIKWVNDTGAAAVVTLVIDSRYAATEAQAPTSGSLSIALRVPLGEIPIANTCAELDDIPMVTPGTHIVVLEGHTNDMSPPSSNSCSNWSGAGADAFVKVRVRARETLNVSYSASCDVQLYLYETCGDFDSCLDGADNGNPERVTYTNNSSSAKDIVVSMDAWSSCVPSFTNPGTLTVALVPPPPAGADTCALAEGKTPVGTGLYFLDFAQATATMDPDDGTGCDVGLVAGGPETFVPIAVGAGQTLDVAFEAGLGDPILYLLEDCDDAATCLDGSDDGTPEVVSWYNPGAATVVYAVVDTAYPAGHLKAPDDGYLEVSVYRPVWPLEAADTCSEAAGLDPITSGLWRVDLGGMSDDLDLEDGAGTPCTDGQRTSGVDAFLKVVLAPGERLTAEWDPSISTSGIANGSIYLLSTCGDPDTCLVGSDAGDPERITHLNSTGTSQTLWLGLDSWHTSGPNRGLLDIAITQ